jgi:mannitol/fructose-specific phosphotransferase system IIA component (Ntr-type)
MEDTPMEPWLYHYEEVDALDSVDEALNVALRIPLEKDAVKSIYLKHVIDEIRISGKYMAITNDVLFLHTRDHESVKRPFISYIHMKKPMDFYDKDIKHVFAFGSLDDDTHRLMLSALSYYIGELREDDDLKDKDAMKNWFEKHYFNT